MSGGGGYSTDDLVKAYYWNDCRMGFGRFGGLRELTCFDGNGYLADKTPTPLYIAWSTARVGGNCWVIINLTIGDDGHELKGHMTPNKEMIAGLGYEYDEAGVYQFTMVRQSR